MVWKLPSRLFRVLVLGWLVAASGGCATLRVTDPAQTADEQFLMTEAAIKAVAQLSFDALRGRSVWVVSEYAFSTSRPFDQSFLTNQVREPQFQNAFLIGEIRSRLLQAGARLAASREQADVIFEVRTGALSINRVDFLLGIPASYIGSGNGNNTFNELIVATPELDLFKSVKQQGYSSVSFVAFWKDTGELLATSGPVVGRTYRNDYFIFGYALPPVGNIPPTVVGPAR